MRTAGCSIGFALAIFTGTMAFAPDACADNAGAVPAIAVKWLTLGEAREALAQGRSRPSQWVRASGPSLAGMDEPRIAWVDADDLANDVVRRQIAAAFEPGATVLVTQSREDGAPSTAASSVFGATSQSPLVYYHREPDGSLRSFSLSGAPSDLASSPHAAAWPTDALAAYLEREKTTMTIRASKVPREAPLFRIVDTAFGPNGSSVTQDIDVVRDTTASSDRKVVIAHASYNAVPRRNGLWWAHIWVPNSYDLRQTLRTDPSFAPALINQYPTSNGSTDITFSERQAATVNFSESVSPEIGAALSTNAVSPSGKIGYGLAVGASFTVEKSFSMTVKDYRVESSASQTSPGETEARWQLKLADSIRGNSQYFGMIPGTAKMSPMMRRAAAQSYAVWSGHGPYEGDMTIEAGARITNAQFRGYLLPVGIHPDADANNPPPVSRITFSAGLPYLTRAITSILQTASGTGNCLVDNAGSIDLQTCSGGIDLPREQWNFDAEGRYRNRGTGRCLQADLSSGGVRSATCALEHTQRWLWIADRIHSNYGGGTVGWRLHIRNGRVHADADPALYEKYPVNPYHPLLKPWSGYPDRPVRGDFVPNLGGDAERIPEGWLQLRGPRIDEFWQVTPLRQGI